MIFSELNTLREIDFLNVLSSRNRLTETIYEIKGHLPRYGEFESLKIIDLLG